MIQGIVLINIASGLEEEVASKIKDIPSISQVFLVYGTYDAVALVEVDDMGKLRDIVLGNIRRIKGVLSTTTLIVMESMSGSKQPT
ncbi:MAG: Lrp/AsnC ligand binding domain-containing protein [Nitrososphaerota archaeon]|nr:Lrp/AsnC ligand binding domain-containing protein [Candidatus Bathyarchaeota archaeon]MCX8162077.1 Lrp/AsnC ligand binding domain-containing protein [Candidatus Bathyarchaeota archaeon]MDW8061737.1 Lrp/AsnC ligand binding domain-containing protein [Nitrososphaerota archaeon]